MLAQIREGAMESLLQLKGYWQLMPYREGGGSEEQPTRIDVSVVIMDVATGIHGICLLDTDPEWIESPLGCQKQAREQKTLPQNPFRFWWWPPPMPMQSGTEWTLGVWRSIWGWEGKVASGYGRRWKGRVGGSRFDQNTLIIFMFKTSNNERMSELEMGLVQSPVVGGVSVSDDLKLFFKTSSHPRPRTQDPN